MKKKVIKYSFFAGLLFMVYFIGMYSYKNESIRAFWSSLSEVKSYSHHNRILGNESKPPSIELLIPKSSKKILQDSRDKAIKAGLLEDKLKIKVPAKLVFEGDTFAISMRLKGDYGDHWEGQKWSYRIQVKGQNRVYGMKSFSVQDPKTRKGLNEWYYQSLLRSEGLIALRHKFVSIKENGIYKGTYNLEESFDKQLLENNKRREAPILKFDESILIDPNSINANRAHSEENLFFLAKVDVFKAKRTLKSPTLSSQYEKGKYLLENVRSRNIELNEAFDVDKAARLFAIADLTFGFHAVRWKNLRFYYNPVIGKLELIGFDSNSGDLLPDLVYNLWRNEQSGVWGGVNAWKSVFFEDQEFVRLYFKYLEKYSSEDFLQKFNNDIDHELKQNLSFIYKDNPWYVFRAEYYKTNATLIREKLKIQSEGKTEIPHAYYLEVQSSAVVKEGDVALSLSVKNGASDPVEILGIFDSENKKISSQSSMRLNGKLAGKTTSSRTFNFDLTQSIDTNQIKFKRNDNVSVYKRLKVGFKYSSSSEIFYVKIAKHFDYMPFEKEMKLPTKGFVKNDQKKVVKIQAGNWVFNEDVVTPVGYTVVCGPNTHLTFNNSSSFIINGAAKFIGSSDSKIRIDSQDSTGTVLVAQAPEESLMEYVVFDGLAESHSGRWNLTGGVNFYESDVVMNHCSFSNNNSEDALNIYLATFSLTDSHFENIMADAFDGDFCKGIVKKCSFETIGNDALDFSGSEIELKGISIKNVKDKGVSAGENSIIKGSQITIDQCELGLVSKGKSILTLDDAKLNNVTVPYLVFQKKGEFGSAKMVLSNFQSSNYKEKYLVEEGSDVTVNGKVIKSNYKDVKSVLYGNVYGEMSK